MMGTTQKSVYPVSSVAPSFMETVMSVMAAQFSGMEFMTNWKAARSSGSKRGYSHRYRPRTGTYWDAVRSERWGKLQKMTNWQTTQWIAAGSRDKDIDKFLAMERRAA